MSEAERGDPGVLRRVLARAAIDGGDAAAALRWVDELPVEEQRQWLAEVWMLAGSLRALAALGEVGGEVGARARAYLKDPPRWDVPRAEGEDAYATLERAAERLAGLGRAAELAMTHLALADAAPRPDWRVVHIEHASSLSLGLGDARVAALVRAYEAQSDAELGENEDAHEGVRAASEMGLAADEPRAVALAARVGAGLPPLEPHPEPPAEDGPTGDRISEPEDL